MGKIAEVGHLPGYAAAGIPVVAVCAATQHTVNRVGASFAIERRYTDWRDMLNDGQFDLVSVCTPPHLHAEISIACLDRGLHTLVEKPIATSIQECTAMHAAAVNSQRVLMIAHNQRFRQQHRIAKQILDSGRLGQVRRAHTVFAHGGPEHWSPNQNWYFDPHAAGNGVLMDLGYHKIDLLRWLLGQEVVDIQAMSATFEKQTTADDTVIALMRFSGGTLATLQSSWAHVPDVPDFVSIACQHGTLTIPSDPSAPLEVVERRQGERITTTYNADAEGDPGWVATVCAFVDAVRNNLPSPVPASEGKATLQAVLSAYASLQA